MSNSYQSKRGFTIVELLIVIVVIAILAAISIVAFTGIQQRGRDSTRAADAANIIKALTACTSDSVAWTDSSLATAADAETALKPGGTCATLANLSEAVADKLQAGSVAADSNVQYRYQVCTTSSVVTGAQISYYKEQTGTRIPLKAGTGTCPATDAA